MTDAEMAIIHLERMLNHPQPAFICAAAGRRSERAFLARVKHFAEKPASDNQLSWLLQELGDPGESLGMLYTYHDGALLFAPTISRVKGRENVRDGGFEFFPIRELKTLSRERTVELSSTENLIGDLLAFARVPLSANLICIRKVDQCKIELVEVNHDAPPGGFGVPTTLEELLALVIHEPAYFLYVCGCYTRYADGISSTQWIPIRYVADAAALSAEQIASEPLPDWWN